MKLYSIRIKAVMSVFIMAYLSSFTCRFIQTTGQVKWKYTPNAMIYKKPVYVQILSKSNEISQVKRASIFNAQKASLGAVIKSGVVGLTLIPAVELKLQHYHLKPIKPIKKKEIHVNGYHFVPNAIFTQDPSKIQILYSSQDVSEARRIKNLTNKELLEVGAAISCWEENCTALAKSTLKEDKIIPIYGA